MLLSRKVDDKEIPAQAPEQDLLPDQRVGHEALGAAVGQTFRPGHDWFFFYYRDRAAALALGSLRTRCSCKGPAPPTSRRAARGRCRRTSLRRACTSPTPRRPPARSSCRPSGARRRDATRRAGNRSPALSSKRRSRAGHHRRRHDERGEFWESLNTRMNRKLPVVYLVEDNGYAISVPVEVNTAGGSISKLVAGSRTS